METFSKAFPPRDVLVQCSLWSLRGSKKLVCVQKEKLLLLRVPGSNVDDRDGCCSKQDLSCSPGRKPRGETGLCTERDLGPESESGDRKQALVSDTCSRGSWCQYASLTGSLPRGIAVSCSQVWTKKHTQDSASCLPLTSFSSGVLN